MLSSEQPFPVIDLYITGNCNFRCPYCFGEDVNKGDISEEIFCRVVKFADYCNTSIGFTGGEPLLHNNFRKLVEIATNEEVPIILRTNGMLIADFLDVLGSFEWIGVSIDGATNSTVKRMRPSSSLYSYRESEKWLRPMNNIQLINKLYPNVKVLLASLVSSFNTPSLIALARMIKESELSIDKWKLYQLTRNNFRSLNTSSKYEIEEDSITELSLVLGDYFDGEIVCKVGDGNCLLVDTNGLVRVNSIIVGSIFEENSELERKIRRLDAYGNININKIKTYHV